MRWRSTERPPERCRARLVSPTDHRELWLTNAMHCPWFLNEGNCCHPPSLHCSLEVGNGGASKTTARPLVKKSENPVKGREQSVGARKFGPLAAMKSLPLPPLSINSVVKIAPGAALLLLSRSLMTATVGDPSLPPPISGPVTLTQVTGPETWNPNET